MVDEVGHGRDDFAEVVRRDVGRHAHGNARSAVDQQIGHTCRQHHRLLQAAVEVVDEIDGIFVDIHQHFLSNAAEAGFGVAHRRRGIAIDAAEVALTVDQGIAHGKILRHAGHGFVNRLVAVGVIFAQHFANDAGRFLVSRVGAQAHVVHGIEDAALDGFEAIASVRQSARHNHAHGVVEVRRAHFVVDVD